MQQSPPAVSFLSAHACSLPLVRFAIPFKKSSNRKDFLRHPFPSGNRFTETLGNAPLHIARITEPLVEKQRDVSTVNDSLDYLKNMVPKDAFQVRSNDYFRRLPLTSS